MVRKFKLQRILEVVKYFAWRIDALNTRIGESVAYLILPMVAIALIEVAARYVFGIPTIWVWDANVQLQGTMVVLAGGYTLLSGKFVVVDVMVGRFSEKAKAGMDLITSIVTLPSVAILVWVAAGEAWGSLLWGEEYTSLWHPPIYPFKIVAAMGAFLLFLQLVSKFIHDLIIIAAAKGEET